ncbi:S-adenosylmethionine:tRNA ribosyltransferase-isomerase [Dawidia soli]|uniref:S-adenosylmethionine:tRNA ribosyltransferase-isomerase n=1 Tax=Dawidia soli TaxID=2782352 RepID=A0AAP2GHL6_9BACT|nr:S-adenosylmethionine:tRNA ribosyltransferase-isomerase [Dawidia soli]MBT1687336.1 S-adenosylmethionine:tRNA ribosyltransferase-isomerase [Dawidia soli]
MKAIDMQDYTYALPPERIAHHPLQQRDRSKLLLYRGGSIQHETFASLPDFLPPNTLLFFNDTKVIPARLHFTKDTGATIEVFLLHPVAPSPLIAEVMTAQGSGTWKCTIGNLKKWAEGAVLEKDVQGVPLRARLLDRVEGLVAFEWPAPHAFAEIIQRSGETPLPPYLKRDAEAADRERYQTVYAHHEGAVAAPTAGLHFTPAVLEALQAKGVLTDFLTLHVSAGTFQPVKVQHAADHTMHTEQILVTRRNLENLLQPERFIVPVGTTSMRTLESLYWYGVRLKADPEAPFIITQHDPYMTYEALPSTTGALERVLARMDALQTDILTGDTSIYIMPGYTFRVCKGLVTNFHQPGSTLILLVAALVGEDWRRIYDEALGNGYRFLSYGDSSLLLPRLLAQV